MRAPWSAGPLPTVDAVSGTHRESLWIYVDDELLRNIDGLAKRMSVTRHELGRIAMRLGVEQMLRRRREGADR
jgi:hypothetical protein